MVGTLRERARLALAARKQTTGQKPVLSTAGCGLVTGSRVATPGGWASVEKLCIGDEVLTFDAGFQRITALVPEVVFTSEQLTPRPLWPLHVPKGTLENRQDLIVPPHQGILVESPDVRDAWGDPYALLPAAALEIVEGVERIEPQGSLSAVLPVFAEDQMVFVNGGTLAFSQCYWGLRAGVRPRFGRAPNYKMLPVNAAQALLETGRVKTLGVPVPELRQAA
ncbi:Hint domain-containing protein [Shimia sp. R11_0]|uniref:Hint domain-containing protein n=1 Tax=Shimia sp. R11_0 TaxID=2821096 RepID=UPI001FFDFB03|nr:Hint domain-containing protein [Shimia sp. R11_0]